MSYAGLHGVLKLSRVKAFTVRASRKREDIFLVSVHELTEPPQAQKEKERMLEKAQKHQDGKTL